jgi:hypothetical protein
MSICSLPCGDHLCHYCVIECLANCGADTCCCPCGQPCNSISLIRAREVITETRSGHHAPSSAWNNDIIEISKSNQPQHHDVDSFRTFMDNLYSLEKEDHDASVINSDIPSVLPSFMPSYHTYHLHHPWQPPNSFCLFHPTIHHWNCQQQLPKWDWLYHQWQPPKCLWLFHWQCHSWLWLFILIALPCDEWVQECKIL